MKLTQKKCQWITGILLLLAFPIAALIPDYGVVLAIVVGSLGWGIMIYGTTLKNPTDNLGEIKDD